MDEISNRFKENSMTNIDYLALYPDKFADILINVCNDENNLCDYCIYGNSGRDCHAFERDRCRVGCTAWLMDICEEKAISQAPDYPIGPTR